MQVGIWYGLSVVPPAPGGVGGEGLPVFFSSFLFLEKIVSGAGDTSLLFIIFFVFYFSLRTAFFLGIPKQYGNSRKRGLLL